MIVKRRDILDLAQKQLPHAPEAEAALLGKLIIDPHQINELADYITGPEDFYQARHATIYAALYTLYERDTSVSFDGLTQYLRDREQLEQIGGIEYLIDLAESVPHAFGIAYHAKLVRDKALIRKLIEASETTWTRALTTAEPASDQVDAAEKLVFEIAQTQTTNSAVSFGQQLHELYAQISEQKVTVGIRTGFADLDDMLNGLHAGEMIIVAARPSMGKTAGAMQIAEYMAVDLSEPVGVFSLEMSQEALAQRMLASRSGVDAQRIRQNMLTPEDFDALQLALSELVPSPIHIDDTAGLTLMQLRAKARRMSAKHGIKALFIDYLQLMSSPATAGQGRQQEVSELSRGIKALARELDVPVVCLSQLNRGPEQREGHRPRMSDLRESGSIEQDADVVLLLHREDYYHRGDPDYQPNNTAEVIIAKQRNGPTGTVKLYFNERTTRFQDMATNFGQ